MAMSVTPVQADHLLYIQDENPGNEGLHVINIASMTQLSFSPGSLDVCCEGFGFDDGRHLVIDSLGSRIFVSDHDQDFDVYDFSLTELGWPGVGISLSEPLGIHPLVDGKFLITDEEGDDTDESLFRLNADLSLDIAASGPTNKFDGAEGVVYDPIHDRIYVADEDDPDIEIFDGSTLAYIGGVSIPVCCDAAYRIGVDGTSNRLFAVFDTTLAGKYGIHVYSILSGGDSLSFETTLFGSGGSGSDCYGTLTVSESRDRLFAVDYCNDTVAIYDTTDLSFLGTVAAGLAGAEPSMVSVGTFHLTSGDGNSDGKIDAGDLSFCGALLGTATPACDLNSNGTVEVDDIEAIVEVIFAGPM